MATVNSPMLSQVVRMLELPDLYEDGRVCRSNVEKAGKRDDEVVRR